MKAFVAAVLAAVVIAAAAGFVLNSYVQKDAAKAFSTASARVS
jgi:hypothetical protein